MGGVFVSYRRQDSQGSTGRLADQLDQLVGDDIPVFVDIDSIRPGQDFRIVIADTLAKCDVTLVVIGPRWLSATDDEGRRRLDDPGDLHRLEVESALSSSATTIPVLVEGATMPTADELPASIQQLAFLHAAEVSVRRFASDAEYLAEMITTEVNRADVAGPPPVPPAAIAAEPPPTPTPTPTAERDPVTTEAPPAASGPDSTVPDSTVPDSSLGSSGRSRRPGLIGAAVAALAAIVGLLVVMTGDDDTPEGQLSDDKSEVTAPDVVADAAATGTDVFSLEVGQCFNADPATAGDMMVVDCADLHFHEVYAIYSSFSGSPPGDDILVDGCLARFEDAVGIDYNDSSYYFSAIWPNDEAWAEGQRDIVCFGYSLDAENRIPTTGSMLGSNR